jgi:hypothetical protein
MTELNQALQTLQATFSGAVILPEDDLYAAATVPFYGDMQNKPAVVLRPKNTADVVLGIEFAKKTGLELAIRSGGHSGAGYSTTMGGVLLDLCEMKSIEVDAKHKTVWAETGSTAGEVTNATGTHDLVIGFGDTGTVGIGGITLGGGVGFLARKFGLAIDNLLAAEIVTANGEVLQVDETQHPDLFWALRGGGGNFGVVTKFKYALHEVKEAYGGMLFLPATPEVLAGYMALAERAPRELSSIINIMPTFPMPFISKEHYGQLSIMAMMMCVGDKAFAEETLKPFRDLATPLADQLKPMRYAEMFPPQTEEYHPMAVSQTMFMNSVDQTMATTIIEELEKFDAPMRAVQLRVLGGAVADVPIDATAYAHRKSKIMVNVAAFYETLELKNERSKWIEHMVRTLDQGDNAVYVNFLSATDEHRVHDAYPGSTLQKLIEVKKKYDPENFFRKCFPLLSA